MISRGKVNAGQAAKVADLLFRYTRAWHRFLHTTRIQRRCHSLRWAWTWWSSGHWILKYSRYCNNASFYGSVFRKRQGYSGRRTLPLYHQCMGGETVGGDGFACDGRSHYHARSGADVWVSEHGQIDETLTGRPGSGCRPLLALHLARDHRVADLPASRLPAGRNTQRCPLLGGKITALSAAALRRVPLGHGPKVRSYQ